VRRRERAGLAGPRSGQDTIHAALKAPLFHGSRRFRFAAQLSTEAIVQLNPQPLCSRAERINQERLWPLIERAPKRVLRFSESDGMPEGDALIRILFKRNVSWFVVGEALPSRKKLREGRGTLGLLGLNKHSFYCFHGKE
jgi:hypothetical protein